MIASRYYLVVVENSGERKISIPLPYENLDMLKCLKKAWKRYRKGTVNDVLAFVESEYGDISEVGDYWACEPFIYREEHDIPLPDDIPFL